MKHLDIRSGLYRDSVRLMQISAALSARPGVSAALVAMATPVNLDMLTDMGFEPPTSSSPNDMVVALSIVDESELAEALRVLDVQLDASGGPGRPDGAGTREQVAARTTASAIARSPATPVVLVSTPGRYAFVEAMDALDAGACVLVFSDNVPIAQEIQLKQTAAARGLLVMGPDCGTAVINGIGLGFANVVRPGPVGLVAASGTGAQHVMSLLAAGGVGVSHCLGVGGRDLSTQVGARSTHAALDALDADPGTELIVLIGKPPAPDVDAAVREHAAGLATPVLVAPLGLGQPDLTSIVEDILARMGVAVPDWSVWEPTASIRPSGGVIRGLFSGGTLCVEAMAIVAEAFGPVRSNVPLNSEWTLDASTVDGHRMLDLGADEYTVGRPHPMVDFGPRLALLERDSKDPRCRVLLLDVVLGHGAHPDPAAELAPAVTRVLASRPTDLVVVISLIGTADDPQNLARQAAALRDAGAWVFASNAAAARFAVGVVSEDGPL